MRLFRRYRELRALAEALVELDADPITGMLASKHPHVVLGLLKDRAKRALA